MRSVPWIKAVALSAAGLLLAVGISACGKEEAPSSGSSPTELSNLDITFTISSTSLAHQLAYAARDGGYFEKFKITPKFVTAESSSVAVQALLSDSAQVAFVGRVDALNSTAAGKKVVYAYKHSTGFLTNVTVSKKFADAHPGYQTMSVQDRLKALNGATIGQASASGVLTKVLDGALGSVGAKATNTYIAVNTMPTALSRGSIDAYMAPSPFQETTVQKGDGVIFIKGTDLPGSGGASIVQGATVVSDSYLSSNRAAVVRVIAALQATAEAMKADPAKAKQLAKDRLKDTDPAVFELMWPDAYTCAIGPLTNPISTDDISFMIKNDAAGNAAAQALDPASQVVPADVVTEAKALVAKVGT